MYGLSIQLDVCAIRPTLRWNPRHRSSTGWRGSVRQQQGRRRRSWQTTFESKAPQRRATSLRWLLAASDGTQVGLFARLRVARRFIWRA
jgi:hypothetical protein